MSSTQESGTTNDAVEHRAFTGYNERNDAFSDKLISSPLCPICGERLKCGRWINQGDKRYMTLCECKADGKFLVRLKFRNAEDDTWTVNRIMYKADAKMEEYYSTKAHSTRPRHSHRKSKRTVTSLDA